MNIALLFPLLLFFFFIVLVLKSFKVVPQSKSMVVFQLGRLKKVCGPGIHLVMPFVEMGQLIDLGKQTMELKSQQVSVLESSPVGTTSIIGYRITDPAKALQNVADYKAALITLSETHLRRCCSEITLTELLTERPKLQERIRESINSDSNKWGVQVDDLEINFVDVPEEVQSELRRQAEKERLRRLMSES
jgi:regulator of protease activity HflC (stomatin/prohibitin superfamily)